jgi:cytochrome c oxidase subunit 2
VLFALLVIAILVAAFLVAIAAGINPSDAVTRVVDSFFPPGAVTDRGQSIRDLYIIVFLIGAVIFFFVEGLILWTVLRYRRRPGDDELPPQTHGNMLAEALWTIIPTIIVAFLFFVSWQTLNSVEAMSAQPELRIRAVAAQFQWRFDYLPADWTPEQNQDPLFSQIIASGEAGGMAVPVGRTINLRLESPDVIHAFYVPQFLFKRDVNPGRPSEFEFTVNPEDAGQTFGGQCAELCGAGHRQMVFEVKAMTPADFDAWLQANIEAANETPPPPPSGEPGGTFVQLAAENVAFDKSELTVPAGEPFQIEFDNRDPSVQHNVAIHEGSPTGPEVFRGDIFPGPEKRTYNVDPLAAGTYGFVCTVHPQMSGTLTAE